MADMIETLAGLAIKAHPELLGPSKSEPSNYPAQGAPMSPADHPANNIEPMQIFEHAMPAISAIKQGFGKKY